MQGTYRHIEQKILETDSQYFIQQREEECRMKNKQHQKHQKLLRMDLYAAIKPLSDNLMTGHKTQR